MAGEPYCQIVSAHRSWKTSESELSWASLYGIAELTRTKRSPRIRQKERVRELFELFNFQEGEAAQMVKAR